MANENDKLQQEQQLTGGNNPSSDGSTGNRKANLCDNEAIVDAAEVAAPVTVSIVFAEGNETNAVCETSNSNNNNNSATDSDGVQSDRKTVSHSTGMSCRMTTTTLTSTNASESLSVSSSLPALVSNCARGQLTDLVADVCFNGARNNDSDAATTLPVGFGDCTNIRATVGVLDFSEGLNIRRVEPNIDIQCTASSSNITNISNSTQQPQSSPAMHIPTAPTQNVSTFSFKHFLSNSSNAFPAPSTTVTSLDPICSVAASLSTSSSLSTTSIATASTTTSTFNGSSQNSTGARPKVPQSTSLAMDVLSGGRCATSSTTSSVVNSADGGDSSGSNIGSTRMKRSPRFSSFDSQASLAEYAATGRSNLGGGDDFSLFSGTCNTTGFRLYPLTGAETSPSTSAAAALAPSKRTTNSANASAQNTGFPSASFTSASTIGSDNCSGIGIGSDRQRQQQQYVPRSYSNYEMPLPPPMSPSPRRRMADAVANIASGSASSSSATASVSTRPNRLSLHPTNASKLKLDLPIDSAAANISGPTDYPPASAAALPDFVQDHWMDALYLHEMHLNSPRSSPTRDFVKATASAVWCNMGAVGGVVGGNSNISVNVGSGGGPLGGLAKASTCFSSQETAQIFSALSVGDSGSGGGGIPNTTSVNNVPNGNGASKMLPDFLSDGPIIHSSQRLADVAAGLPSNSIGSPEDPTMTSQLSKLCLEVERLQRELSETRTALCEQTRRANELERQMQEESRRRAATPTAQQVMRLKQQLAEMAEEAELLRRENEALREDGAVGGYSDNATSQRTESRYVRPATTRSQQISQALLRAASNAENNLRQLLTGVDNLRQMAADIEDPALRLDYDGNSDIFPDFVDDFDGFEDFSGGPAL